MIIGGLPRRPVTNTAPRDTQSCLTRRSADDHEHRWRARPQGALNHSRPKGRSAPANVRFQKERGQCPKAQRTIKRRGNREREPRASGEDTNAHPSKMEDGVRREGAARSPFSPSMRRGAGRRELYTRPEFRKMSPCRPSPMSLAHQRGWSRRRPRLLLRLSLRARPRRSAGGPTRLRRPAVSAGLRLRSRAAP